MAESAISQTLADHDLSDERLADSDRSVQHAFDNKKEAMEKHVAKLIDRRLDIKLLYREAKAPGYAHQTPERMKELISGAWQEFKIILDVMRIQRGWDDETSKRAEATLIHNLTQGAQNIRVGHWRTMLELSDNYLGARIALFKNRIRRVSR